jgi:NAD+ synthase (glutamine-hydrolysing)
MLRQEKLMRIAMAQINPTVGDIASNTEKICQAMRRARELGAELVVTPELSILGYPPRDLLLKPAVLLHAYEAVKYIARQSTGITTLVGFADANPAPSGRSLFNAVAAVRDGEILSRAYKSLLPTYDVFDETRYFEPGPRVESIRIGGRLVGLTICEDLWNDDEIFPRPIYHYDPIREIAASGAEILVNISASPFVMGKNALRRRLIIHQARRWKIPIVYVNQVGANDELIFDGNSVAVDANGNILACAADFIPDLALVDVAGPGDAGSQHQATIPPEKPAMETLHRALVLGIADYAAKCRFKSAVLGLSGGIDSAVVACLAAAALGPDHVLGVSMPSRFSSDHSKGDAASLAAALAIKYQTLPIESAHAALEHLLSPLFKGLAPGLAEENMQARIRGNILMAISNKFGHLLLTTGNKSEVATGYCTLYGDMCGGLAVISDVPKTMVYELAKWINRHAEASGLPAPIPASTLTKPPSAELRPNQTDQDSLPPYDQLDAILQMYVEEEQSIWDITAQGFDKTMVEKVVRLVDINEYKRKQMPPGLKVTSRAFGFGRRMPIAQQFNPSDRLPES